MAKFVPYVYNQSTAKPVTNLEGKTVQPPKVYDKTFAISNKIPIWVQWNMHVKSALFYFRPASAGEDAFHISDKQASRPYNLSESISYKSFSEGMKDFWEAIRSRNFVLVWPSDCSENNATTSGRVSRFSIKNDGEISEASRKLEEIKQQTAADRELFEARSSVNASEGGELTINDRLMGIVSRFTAGDLKPDAAGKEIDRILEDLTTQDLSWAVAQTNGKLRNWLKEKLADQQGDSLSTSDSE